MVPMLLAIPLLVAQDLPNEARIRKQRDTWLDVARHRPKDVEAWHRVAEAERELRNWDAAIAAESRAIEGHGKYAAAYAGRARAHFEKRQFSACRKDCGVVIDLLERGRGRRYYVEVERPKEAHLDAYRLRGLAFGWEQRWNECLDDFAVLVELAPQRADFQEERAHLAQKGGRKDTAAQGLLRAGLLRLDSGDRRGAEGLAQRLRDLGASQAAAELAARLAASAPRSDLP